LYLYKANLDYLPGVHIETSGAVFHVNLAEVLSMRKDNVFCGESKKYFIAEATLGWV